MSIHYFILLLLLIFSFQIGAEETLTLADNSIIPLLDKVIPRAELTDTDCAWNATALPAILCPLVPTVKDQNGV
jgi:hypothetical protein